ncbi:MAG: LamG domain-containing protein [Mucilaginibacter sp.]
MKKNPISLALAVITTCSVAFFACNKSDALKSNTGKFSVNGKSKTFSLNRNLVAYWPMDGNATDLSGNGNNGTLNSVSSTTDRFGNTGGALSFNGSSSYVSVADNAALRLSSTDFTLNAWVKLDTYNSSYGSQIMSKRTSGANNGWGWSITGYSSSPVGVGFYGPGGGSTNAFGTDTIGTGTWHMITSVYNNSAQQLTIYIDGVFDNVTSSVASPNGSITAALNIGRDVATAGYYFQGAMDEVRIYNAALDTAAINGLFHQPNPSGLIAYWSFDGDVKDYSGNGNNGTGYNLTAVTDRFGRSNSAYYFDGSSSYVSVPDNSALRLSSTDITLNAWVKLDTYNASYGSQLMSKRTSGANNGWGWSITGYSSYPVGVGFYGPGGGSANAYGTTVIGTSSWHMITSVYSYSGQQLSIYIDGVYDSTTSSIATPNGSITAAVNIGRDVATAGYYFQGAMDDIRIYGRALNSTEISGLYTAVY